MTPSRIAGIGAVLATVALTALGTARPAAAQTRAIPSADMPGEAAARAKARTDSARYPYTKADIDFMTGMIGHHSQAKQIHLNKPHVGAVFLVPLDHRTSVHTRRF